MDDIDGVTNTITLFPGELPEEQSVDDLFALLADQQRRRLLVVLQEAETSVGLSALARKIAGDATGSDTEGEEWIRINLHHCHIPGLAEAGLISYDEDQATAELTEQGRAVAEALDL